MRTSGFGGQPNNVHVRDSLGNNADLYSAMLYLHSQFLMETAVVDTAAQLLERGIVLLRPRRDPVSQHTAGCFGHAAYRMQPQLVSGKVCVTIGTKAK